MLIDLGTQDINTIGAAFEHQRALDFRDALFDATEKWELEQAREFIRKCAKEREEKVSDA